MTQTNLLKKAVLLSGVAIIAFAATAHAGFEWKGPLGAPAPAAEAPPVDTQPNDDLTPVTSWEKPADEPAAMPAPVHAAPVHAAPVTMSPSPVDEMPAPVTAAPATTWTPPANAPAHNDVAVAPVQSEPAGDLLSGFGSDVPLVIALQQIVPPGYQYSFAAGVNPGVSVSWEGGKSWQQVLADTLAAHGLGYRLQNNTVVIGNYASDVPAQQASAPEAAPAASDASLGMSSVPQEDTAPVAITSTAPDASVPAETAGAPVKSTVISEKPVTIHREKRSSLLERLGWTKGTKEEKRENIAVPSETAGNAPAPSWSAPEAAPEAAPVNDTAAPVAPAAPVSPAAPDASDAGMSADPMPMEESSASSEPQQLAAAKPYSRSAADAAMSSSATEVGATTATPVAATGNWSGAKGQTLRDVLKTWSDKAGVELYWSIDYDYRLSDDISSSGTYDQAVGGLLDKFATVRPQPYGQLHQSASGPRVLVVKSYDLTR